MTATPASDWASSLDRAREAVAAALPPTPLIPSPRLGEGVLLKLETFQPTGSFKVRGALAAVTMAGNPRGVVTASTGNHALGIAWAARRAGIPATAVVPATASPAKLTALRRYPVTVVVHGDRYEEAEQHARSLAHDGLCYLPASGPAVIAGQATVAVELLTQVSANLTVICPIGGGGLASGLGLAATRSGRMTIIGVEAAASPAMSAALRAGQVIPIHVRETLADGLAGNLEPAAITPGLIGDHVRSLLSVTEDQIAQAIGYLAGEHGMIVEGAGAVSVAAILAGLIPVTGPTVAIITGRNITTQVLCRALQKGAPATTLTGRKAPMTFELINPEGLPTPPTYTHVVVAAGGKTVFIAGQEPEDAHGNLIGPGDLAAQARQVFANLRRALAAAGAHPRQVTKITIYVVRHRPEYLPVIEEARADVFGDHKPADTLVGVETLAQPGYLIEVDAIAVIDS